MHVLIWVDWSRRSGGCSRDNPLCYYIYYIYSSSCRYALVSIASPQRILACAGRGQKRKDERERERKLYNTHVPIPEVVISWAAGQCKTVFDWFSSPYNLENSMLLWSRSGGVGPLALVETLQSASSAAAAAASIYPQHQVPHTAAFDYIYIIWNNLYAILTLSIYI